MKTVLLFRHGKSDWHADYSHDHERPLAARGRRAARAMGRWLTETGPAPDYVVCSTAVRARQTFSHAEKSGHWGVSAEYERRLYGAMPMDLLECIRGTHDDCTVLMLVGHQPTWSETTALLAQVPVMHFPTATMARVDLRIGCWLDAEFGCGSLAWLQRPKQLPAAYCS